MLAAAALGHALADAGVERVFANPGTTELHLVRGFADVPRLTQILTLFEGVASGAADGYGRMTGRPAVVLLHLGPGLGNALANLHNARRARTPIVVIVGDHATTHKKWDAPLQSDIAAIAGSFSVWVREARDPASLSADGIAAVQAAIAGRGIATLIVPADIAWAEIEEPVDTLASAPETPKSPDVTAAVAALRNGSRTALLIGGGTLDDEGLAHARAIAAATGATILSDTFLPRTARGNGDPGIEPLPYFGEMAKQRLAGYDQVVLIGAAHPTGFFAYPGQSGDNLAAGVTVIDVRLGSASPGLCLKALANALNATAEVSDVQIPFRPAMPANGPLTPMALGQALAKLMPHNAIVSDEANTTGPYLWATTASAAWHDWLKLTGGAIGQGLPLATGAAVAAGGRRVVALQSDGSSLYTIQSLWTQAREQLDVTTVLLNNGHYAILELEMGRLGLGGCEDRVAPLFDLGAPSLDFVALAQGFGVHARGASTVAEFAEAFAESIDRPGPMLIDARLAT